jgi:hypothetical protein
MLLELFEGYILLNVLFSILTVILILTWYVTKKDKYAQLAFASFIIAPPF